jgi:hypothetical protein
MEFAAFGTGGDPAVKIDIGWRIIDSGSACSPAQISLFTYFSLVRTVSKHAQPRPEAGISRIAEGGRTCPLPSDMIALHGPWGTRRAKRRLVSTGVVTADVGARA